MLHIDCVLHDVNGLSDFPLKAFNQYFVTCSGELSLGKSLSLNSGLIYALANLSAELRITQVRSRSKLSLKVLCAKNT